MNNLKEMDLTQVADQLQNMPLELVMRYANGENPAVVPEYVATGEMNRRKMLEDAAKGVEAITQFPTVKASIQNALLQPSQTVDPAAAQQMVNPVAAQTMANPTAAPQGLVNLAAAQPQVNMGAAPTAMMAEGGMTALMPSLDRQDYQSGNSPLEMGYGGLAAIPTQGMFQSGSYAGGGIVAFDDNKDQPVSLDMPANNTPSSSFDKYSPDEILKRLIATQTASNANPPVPIPGSETAEVTRSDASPVVTPATAETPAATATRPAVRAPSGEFVPVIKQPVEKTVEQIIADKQLLNKRFGVIEDPMAEIKALQNKNYARQQEQIGKDDWNRFMSNLAAPASADPTKGIGAIGAAITKNDQQVAAVQNAYKDKIEEANIQFKSAVAKEEDARRRGDVKGIEEAQAAQQKAQFEYGKYTNDLSNAQSNRISAGASASQAGTAALRAKLEADANPNRIKLLEAQAKEAGARADAALAGMDSKEQKAVKDSLSSDESYKRWSQTVQPREKGGQGYAPGTPQGEAITAYLSDLQASRAFEIRNNLPIGSMAPTPPKITKDSIKEVPGKFFGTNEVAVPGTIEAHKPGGFIPVPIPQGAKQKDLIVGRQVYILPNEERAIWNGKQFVVVK
jgi:hypothetical protein